jgi:hypothetical protein
VFTLMLTVSPEFALIDLAPAAILIAVPLAPETPFI